MAQYKLLKVTLAKESVEAGFPTAQTVRVVIPNRGPAGPRGADGERGADGAPGADSTVPGPQGETGPAGPQGEDGASAYEVAVSNGYSGTEEQWLASLVGPQGPQGEPGEGGGVTSYNDLTDIPESFPPESHAASHLSEGSDPLYDQDLSTTDAPTFASLTIADEDNEKVGVGTIEPSRKYHQVGGKFAIESSDSSYGQFQVANPNEGGEVAFIFGAGSTIDPETAAITTVHKNEAWAFGCGSYGRPADTFVIANGLGIGDGPAPDDSVFHLRGGKCGIGVGTFDPQEALDVGGNVLLKDLENQTTATFDAQGNLTDNRTYALPDGDGVLVLDSQLGTVATSNSYDDLDDLPTLGTAAAADIGSGAGEVCAGDDARLSDARTPLAHKTSHAVGGTDALSAADIGAAAASHTHSDATTSVAGFLSASDKTKLDGIASGAEVNVQADWNQSSNSADDYIKNKPTIPSAVSIDSTAADILSVLSGAISADDLGADKLWGWDDSASKAIGFTIGSGLETDTTTLKAKITSDPTGVSGAGAITNIMSLTQAEYAAIGSPNASTLYIITDP